MFRTLRRRIAAFKSPVTSDADRSVVRLCRVLQGLGLAPSHVVDIGANQGGWSRAVLSAFPGINLTLFEPQRRLADSLSDLAAKPNVVIHYKGVGAIDGVLPFTLHDRDDSCSFVYDSAEAAARGFSQSEIEICRLDTALSNTVFGPPDIVKVDAEGLDLEVLEGSTVTLESTQVVLVEASIANRDYPNTLLAVVRKMDELGFRLFDFTDLNRSPGNGVLWLVEAVFVRKGSLIDISGSRYE